MKRDELGRRRARVARVNAKRPRAVVNVELAYAPEVGAGEGFVEVLLELLRKRATPA